MPTLYIFNISHYCEKARWALDHFGIAHRVQPVMVGTQGRIGKTLGTSSGSVPFLQIGERVIVGSSAIIDWCEVQTESKVVTLEGDNPEQARACERRLDSIAGVHVRRFFFSDALSNAPASVRPIFTSGLPFWQKAVVTLAWPRIVAIMKKSMDLGPEQGQESRMILDAELSWLDGLLADGRPFIAGNRWSRADLTAASLLAQLVIPDTHPTYHALELPEAFSATISAWAERPALRYVRRMYAAHR